MQGKGYKGRFATRYDIHGHGHGPPFCDLSDLCAASAAFLQRHAEQLEQAHRDASPSPSAGLAGRRRMM